MTRPLAIPPVSATLLATGLLLAPAAFPHGEGDWNDFKVDNKNESVATTLAYARRVISDVVLGRREVTSWPDPEMMHIRNQLAHLSEEVDAMLGHFREDGVVLQVKESLREHPRAGQSVAASHAIETCIELIDHVAALDNVEAFAEELHSGGVGAYLFDLMDAYMDNMSLYGSLVHHAH